MISSGPEPVYVIIYFIQPAESLPRLASDAGVCMLNDRYGPLAVGTLGEITNFNLNATRHTHHVNNVTK